MNNILSQIQLVLTHNGEFGINTNILETNLINQILIIPIVIFAFNKAGIKESITERQKNTINLIENSEKRLNEASNRLNDTKKQLSQAFFIIDEIQKETNSIKIQFLNNSYIEAKSEIKRRFAIALNTVKNREYLILIEIKQNMAFLALKQVLAILKKDFNTDENSWGKKYVEESIQMVGLKN